MRLARESLRWLVRQLMEAEVTDLTRRMGRAATIAPPGATATSRACGTRAPAGVVAAGGRRWVDLFCPVTRRANRSLTFIVLIRWCTGAGRSFRAQKFPREISLSAAFSSSASASSRLSVAFSRSRSLSRLASSAFIPPNWLRHR
jgi:hypothetical protein